MWVLFLRNFYLDVVANEEKAIQVLWSECWIYKVMATEQWHHWHWDHEWSRVLCCVVGFLGIRQTLIPVVNPQDEKLCLHFNKRSVVSQFLGTSRSQNCSFRLLKLNPNYCSCSESRQARGLNEPVCEASLLLRWRRQSSDASHCCTMKASLCWMEADQKKVWDSKNFCCNRICDCAPRLETKWSKIVFFCKQGHLQETVSTSAAH